MAVDDEYVKAITKHPEFCSTKEQALALIAEELGELAKAILEGANDIEEAAHVAVTAIRYIEKFKEEEY